MQIEQAINSGKPKILITRKNLNKTFLKVKPNRSLKEELQGIHMSLVEQPASAFSLEANIAQIVYEVYGLTEEEIQII